MHAHHTITSHHPASHVEFAIGRRGRRGSGGRVCVRVTHPSTSSILDRMDPSSDSCTTRSWLDLSAKMHTIISVALPKEALSSPPSVWFV